MAERDMLPLLTAATGKSEEWARDCNEEVLTEVIEDEHDRIFQMAQAQEDLGALEYLVEYAESYIQRIRNRDITESVINSGAQPIRDPTPARLSVLEELRTRAFGKAVILTDDRGEVHVYRIAQANESCIGDGYVIVNRLAPVARSLVAASPGDIVSLPNLGQCEVLAISLLDGPKVRDVRDFRSMQYKNLHLWSAVAPLTAVRPSLQKWRERLVQNMSSSDPTNMVPEEVEAVDRDTRPPKFSSSGSLGAQFYTRTTHDQEEVIRQSGSGIMVVEGVAGSGKTSVALGRTKALCDRRFESEESEQWDDFFTPESAIGFVLNAQLVEYLKETRDQLYISDMPVLEYNQLRQRLVRKRADVLQISLSPSDRQRYRRTKACNCVAAGTMELLREVEAKTALAYAKRLRLKRGGPKKLQDTKEKVSPVGMQVWESAYYRIDALAEELERRVGAGGAVWEGVGREIENLLNKIQDELDPATLWLSKPIHGRWIQGRTGEELVRKLRNLGCSVWTSIDGTPVPVLSHEEQLEKLHRDRASLYAVEGSVGREPSHKSLSEADKATIDALLKKRELRVQRDGRWKRVRLHEEIAAAELLNGNLLVATDPSSDDWILLGADRLFGDRGKHLRRAILDRARDVLVNQMALPDLMRESVLTSPQGGRDGRLTESLDSMLARLEERTMADSDIDVFLAIAHKVSLRSQKTEGRFSQPDYYSTVFIDEVQDFTEIQVYLMAAHADPRRAAATVVGDFCQQLYNESVRSIDACFEGLGEKGIRSVVLSENKRQASVPSLAEFSAWFRAAIQSLRDGDSVPRSPEVFGGNALSVGIVKERDIASLIERELSDIAADESVAVICPSADIARTLEEHVRDVVESHFRESKFSEDNRDLTRPYYVHFTTPAPTKGLEFDAVLMPYFDEYDWSDPVQQNAAYVAVTRARSKLHISAASSFEGSPLANDMQSHRGGVES